MNSLDVFTSKMRKYEYKWSVYCGNVSWAEPVKVRFVTLVSATSNEYEITNREGRREIFSGFVIHFNSSNMAVAY